MRLKTGEYEINFFDAYGQKVNKIQAVSVTRAMKKARRYAKIKGYASWQIIRAIYNSLDKDNQFEEI